MEFSKFKTAMQRQFLGMKEGTLFQVALDKDKLWEHYLASYPPGSNPKFRERTEHDCSACRHFIKSAGGLVTISDKNKLISIWDLQVDDPNFQAVADAMSAFVKSHQIENLFLHPERAVGVDQNYDEKSEGKPIRWQHFFLTLPTPVVVPNAEIGSKLSETRATYDVMLRSLTELDLDSVDAVLELIAQNSLYRGEEQKFALTEFRKLKVAFSKVKEEEKSLFCWSKVRTVSEAVSRIRNTMLGSLLVDLSGGMDLEDAVKAFETKAAPANYKRPTALVTQKMIENAKKTVVELGLTSALDRRYATLVDLPIKNVLFADRSAKEALGGSVFDEITPTAAKGDKRLGKVEEVSIEDFITKVLPTATSLEVMVENRLTPNFVSLIAPSDLTAKNLFKWPNNFSWSYQGDFADSIKERVKKAGGKVDGDLRCSLSWFNYDDLDLHVIEPNGNEIYFARRRSEFTGGNLDVDMNAGGLRSKTPVENICFPRRVQMLEGTYKVVVNSYSRRESTDVGFEVEVEFDGTMHTFSYAQAVKQSENVTVAEISYTRTGGFKIVKSLPSTQASKEVWGVTTQTFVPVTTVLLSPNYWDGEGVGNKHYLFMLQGCRNEGAARGFYNEFLPPELNEHRKVLEIVGSKVRAASSDEQLSGLGFSTTQRNHLLCRVKGTVTRTVKVIF